MATWSELVAYVRANYRIADEKPSMLQMVFETGDNRSQIVILWRHALMDGQEEWLQIESPVGEVDKIDLRKLLEAVGGIVCGGAAVMGDHVTIRHAVPLANLDINEFERPLVLVTSTADRLEQQLVGGDKY